jgi:hypothetical protein
MSDELEKGSKTQLALALARGVSAGKWARSNNVTEITAYRWAREPEVRKLVESFRRRMIDQAVGEMTKQTVWAARGIVALAKESESDTVRLRALRSIFSDMITASKYSGLEQRMCELEERVESTGTPSWAETGYGQFAEKTLPPPGQAVENGAG